MSIITAIKDFFVNSSAFTDKLPVTDPPIFDPDPITVSSAGQTYTYTGSISTAISPIQVHEYQALTSEEKKELADLNKVFNETKKSARISAFAGLPPSNREAIIAATKIGDDAEKVRNAEPTKTQRHKDLENRNASWFNGTTITYGGWPYNLPNYKPDTGLTLEEMEKAHADASFDEVVLDRSVIE